MININNKFAVVIAYYLARFNREGLDRLGYKSFSEAFRDVAEKLDVKKNYIKLRRDEFDFIYSWRKGWQRPMHRQILRTIEAFQDMDEIDLREIVLNILNNSKYKKTEEAEKIATLIKEDTQIKIKEKKKRKNIYILRGPTGKKAEEFFIQQFNQNKFPFSGKLLDRRDYGCGYDFEIQSQVGLLYVEVKGVIDVFGGILFTNKEWLTACEKKDLYYLIIISSLNTKPKFKVIQNPAAFLNPEKSIYTSVQVQWSVSKKALNKS